MALIRIVKMTFDVNKVETFKKLFATIEDKIRNFEGCHGMEAYQDVQAAHIIFTYSIWDSAEKLENYRNSELFKSTWSQTKPLFSEPAQAWSVEKW